MISRIERDTKKANEQAKGLEKRINNRQNQRAVYQRKYDKMMGEAENLRSLGYKEDSHDKESKADLVKSKIDSEDKKIATLENSLRLHNNKWTRAGVIVTGKRLL